MMTGSGSDSFAADAAAFSLTSNVERTSKSHGIQPAIAATSSARTRRARKYAVAQRSLLAPKCTPGAKRC